MKRSKLEIRKYVNNSTSVEVEVEVNIKLLLKMRMIKFWMIMNLQKHLILF